MGDYIGIDVSKATLDICYLDEVITIPNQLASIQQWIQKIKKYKCIELVVCEATGGYERILVKMLQKEGIPVFAEHANKIRAFAKTKGLLAKTDRIDAKLIAEYAYTMQPRSRQYSLSEDAEPIRDLLKRRNQLLDDKARETARIDKEPSARIKKFISKHIEFLDKQLEAIQKEIKQLSEKGSIQEEVNLLTSIPGVGQQTALMILTLLPEIGSLENKSLAALVGVAPFNRDSGQFRGKRFVQGGRKTLRKALYMAAVAAVRWNKPLADFYHRLRAKGKPAKVAIVAVMNKLLAMANSVYKRKSPWIEKIA